MSLSLFILTLVPWAMRHLLQFCSFQLQSKISWGQKEAREASSATSCSQQGQTPEVRPQAAQGFVWLYLEKLW